MSVFADFVRPNMDLTRATVKSQVRGTRTAHNTGKSASSQMRYHAKRGDMRTRIERDIHVMMDQERRKRPEKRKHKLKEEVRRSAQEETH